MKIFCILLLVFFSFSRPSFAGLFGPNTYNECFKQFALKAHSAFAANILDRACKDQFLEKTKQAFTNYVSTGGMPSKLDPQTGHILVYSKDIGEWIDLFTAFILYQAAYTARGKCILRLTELLKAENDFAAKAILRNARCTLMLP